MDFNIIGDIMAAVADLKAGSVAGVGALLTVAVRVYRMFGGPWPSEKWGWLVTLVTFIVGMLAAMLTGVFGFSMGWGPAVLAALGVAVNAAGFHATTKAVGRALPAVEEKTFKESPFRSVGSLLIPRVQKAKDALEVKSVK